MTLKQQKVIELLPEHNYNMAATMRAVGYAKGSCYTEQGRIGIKRILKAKYFDEETIRSNYKKLLKASKDAKDRTNSLRALEGMARIEGLMLDRNKIDITNNTTQEAASILDKYMPDNKA